MLRWDSANIIIAACGIIFAVSLPGCRSPGDYRREADRAAYDIVERAREKTGQQAESFTIEPPADTLRRQLMLDQNLPQSVPAAMSAADLKPIPHWPDTGKSENQNAISPIAVDTNCLTLADALQIAARNNREYQTRKERVFQAALALDLQANQFRNLLAGDADTEYKADYTGDNRVRGLANTGRLSWQRRLKYGTLLTTQFAVDLVKLLTLDRSSSMGLMADATISMPLMRGAGRHIVTEPLTQAEQDMVYTLFAFERYKQTLAARVISEYLAVLQLLDQVENAMDNYHRIAISTKRARRLADAGRLPSIQVDQTVQDDLRARDRWISARQTYARRLDLFKIILGLPTDAAIKLDHAELIRMADAAGLANDEVSTPDDLNNVPDPDAQEAGRTSALDEEPGQMIDEREAIKTALTNRLDMLTAEGRVYDAQRHVVVAADALRMGLTLMGAGTVGERRHLSSADSPDAQLRFNRGTYTSGLGLDLPLERTAERNAWRNSLIALEQSVRETAELEDQIKIEVRNSLRAMLQARESHRIQKQALVVATRRVDSTELFLKAGRAQVRDQLEAQEALVSARNSLTAATVNYRTAEIQLLRDMGVLAVDQEGNLIEYLPENENE